MSTTVELKDQQYRDLQKCRNDRSMAMETFGEKTVLQLVPVRRYVSGLKKMKKMKNVIMVT